MRIFPKIAFIILLMSLSSCVSNRIGRRDVETSISKSYERYILCDEANNEDMAFILRLISEKSREERMDYDSFYASKKEFFKLISYGEVISEYYPIIPSTCTVDISRNFSNDLYLFFRFEVETEYRFFVIEFSRASSELISKINEHEFRGKSSTVEN